MAVQNLIESRIENPKINFLLDFKFLVLAKDKALREMYISYLDGVSKHSALEIQYEESLHR